MAMGNFININKIMNIIYLKGPLIRIENTEILKYRIPRQKKFRIKIIYMTLQLSNLELPRLSKMELLGSMKTKIYSLPSIFGKLIMDVLLITS